MNYIDLDGIPVRTETGQDKLLSFLYTNVVGRILLKLLINRNVSVLSGRLLDMAWSAILIRPFIERNKICMGDFEQKTYHSFNDFFTRKILPGKRPLCGDPYALISPCDCRATVYPISSRTTFSVKNTEYTLRSLLRSPRLAKRFENGYAYILRLAVDDYHRYIFAASGSLSKTYHIDGTFHTVNPIANDCLPIYKENTREYTVIHSPVFGDIVQMEVGALLVGRITNDTSVSTAVRGEEKGYFEYGGSTIILLTNADTAPRVDLLQNTLNGYETRILQGQELGR
ncbi:MAG: phosphatidylserine decarboxylase [Eubacterium sp.]|nr:phosphatidylserine decarboxylase [Eubacterium sp.]